jgi:fibronectin type 3 domain-containing protein
MKSLRLIAMALALILVPGLFAQQVAQTTLSIVVTHAAILTWTASTSPNITTYNVYRGTQSGGPYAKINSLNSLTFTDTSGISGTTYFWVVTAVDTNNLESPFSNEVTATWP